MEALETAKLALNKQVNLDIQEQYVLALMMNSDYASAEQYIQTHRLNMSRPHLQHIIKLSEFS